MVDKNIPTKLLNKEVTRRQFIKGIGLMFLGIIGVNSFVSSVSKSLDAKLKGQPKNAQLVSKSRRFGNSKYGV